MDYQKIKKALQDSLDLLNREIVTEITVETKNEYLNIINELVDALREFD